MFFPSFFLCPPPSPHSLFLSSTLQVLIMATSFVFFVGFLCVIICVSAAIYISCDFYCIFFLFYYFVIFQPVSIYLILFHYFPYASLFSNETKNVDPDGRGSEKEQGKIRETVNKIYCMNQIHFRKRKKKSRFHKHTHNAIKKVLSTLCYLAI